MDTNPSPQVKAAANFLVLRNRFPRVSYRTRSCLLAVLVSLCGPNHGSAAGILTDVHNGVNAFADVAALLNFTGAESIVGTAQFCATGLSALTPEYEDGVEYGGKLSKGGVSTFGRIIISAGDTCYTTYIQGQQTNYFDTGSQVSG